MPDETPYRIGPGTLVITRCMLATFGWRADGRYTTWPAGTLLVILDEPRTLTIAGRSGSFAALPVLTPAGGAPSEIMLAQVAQGTIGEVMTGWASRAFTVLG